MEHQTVRTVQVSLLKVVAKSYMPVDNMIVLEIYFNDGKNRKMERSTRLTDPNLLAIQLLDELVDKERNDYLHFDGESLAEADVSVQNVQKTRLILRDFFRSLQCKALQINKMKSSEGYLNLLKGLQRSQVTFYG